VSAVALAVDGGVEQIIDNLVDNALEVSPEGTTVRIVVEVGDGSVMLHVIDEGPGLRDEQLERAVRALLAVGGGCRRRYGTRARDRATAGNGRWGHGRASGGARRWARCGRDAQIALRASITGSHRSGSLAYGA